MNMLTRKREFLQPITVHVPRKLSRLFSFGCAAIVGHTVVSLRANARITNHGWFTAKSKAWRLTANKNLIAAFHTLFSKACPVIASDIVAVDFSDFKNGWQVLMFARQTKHGRAYPLFFNVLERYDSDARYIIDRYYHRFEIKEFFRDAKRLLELEHHLGGHAPRCMAGAAGCSRTGVIGSGTWGMRKCGHFR